MPFKRFLFIAAFFFIVITFLYFQMKSKTKNKEIIINEINETDDPSDILSIQEPANKYDLYGEIKTFMNKQTSYVMNV